ncbi:MAG: outer membrane beta-barrel protein, partial [Bacteroidota bacterium]
MKKQLLTLALLFLATLTFAQEFKAFKVGIGFGFAGADGGEGGPAFYLEPAYRASDEVAIGLRIEGAVLLKGVANDDFINTGDGSASVNGSYTLNGQYYLSNEKFRPFVGLGFGIYSIVAGELVGDDGAGSSKINFSNIHIRGLAA